MRKEFLSHVKPTAGFINKEHLNSTSQIFQQSV